MGIGRKRPPPSEPKGRILRGKSTVTTAGGGKAQYRQAPLPDPSQPLRQPASLVRVETDVQGERTETYRRAPQRRAAGPAKGATVGLPKLLVYVRTETSDERSTWRRACARFKVEATERQLFGADGLPTRQRKQVKVTAYEIDSHPGELTRLSVTVRWEYILSDVKPPRGAQGSADGTAHDRARKLRRQSMTVHLAARADGAPAVHSAACKPLLASDRRHTINTVDQRMSQAERDAWETARERPAEGFPERDTLIVESEVLLLKQADAHVRCYYELVDEYPTYWDQD